MKCNIYLVNMHIYLYGNHHDDVAVVVICIAYMLSYQNKVRPECSSICQTCLGIIIHQANNNGSYYLAILIPFRSMEWMETRAPSSELLDKVKSLNSACSTLMSHSPKSLFPRKYLDLINE